MNTQISNCDMTYDWLLRELRRHVDATYCSELEREIECRVNERLQHGSNDGCLAFPACDVKMNFDASDSRTGSVVIDLFTPEKISVSVTRVGQETLAVANAYTWVPTVGELKSAEQGVLYAMTHPVPKLPADQ